MFQRNLLLLHRVEQSNMIMGTALPFQRISIPTRLHGVTYRKTVTFINLFVVCLKTLSVIRSVESKG